MRSKDDRWGHGSRYFMFGFYLGMLVLLIGVNLQGAKNQTINYYSNISGVLIPLFGCLLGFRRLHNLKKTSRSIYRIVPTLFNVSFLGCAIGNLIWIYYNFVLQVEIPYPSLGDVGWSVQAFCQEGAVIVLLLMFYNEMKTSLLKEMSVIVPFLLAAWGATITIMVFAHGGVLSRFSPSTELVKFVLDVGYPIVDSIGLTFLVTLIFGNYWSKVEYSMKYAILVLMAGLSLGYITDLVFEIVTSLPPNSPLAYYNGGPTDFMYDLSYFLTIFGVLLLPLDNWIKDDRLETLNQ